jgi:cyclic dehypoxanthinyl futalosine synthase
MSNSVEAIIEKALSGTRITQAEAVLLLEQASLHDLGRAALSARQRLHPEPVATFVIDRNINYTNVCVVDCEFCAFSRRLGDPEAYVLSREDLNAKIRELIAAGGTQVLLQGGHHPQLTLAWYEELIGGIHREFPAIHIHAFSPAEIVFFSKLFKLPVRDVIRRLKAAGLHSIPGGGAEILVDRVRQIVAPRKATTDEWLNVMQEASQEGLRGSATMVIGHVETRAERIEHLERVRRVQDEHGPFTAFILWTMQPHRTRMEGRIAPAGAYEYLRTLAVARIFLDNVPNVQASWVTQGAKIGQLAFLYGANDWGGLMLEENVVSAAGTRHCVQIEEMRRLSAEIGLELRQRDFFYRYCDRA